ncbi:hypothetical protein LJC52_04130 [Bacteroidales bacterium OttesenSCG-928-A17]|nr:hypothetical protein [Bacteroidales bacterium OttesenSCG-928-A17]
MSAEDNSSNLETNQSLPYDLFVVSKVSGKYLNNSYVYKYPQIHKAYRGFLGFLNVEVKDNIYYTHSISESKLNSTYNTLYPWKTTVKRTSGANISEQISSYSFKTFTQNKRFCLQLDSVSSQDFLKGITQTKHHSNYDAVMNPGTIRTIFGEGIEQVETYVYTAGSHWCANKIDSSQIEYKKEGESIIRSSSYTYDSKDNLLAKTSDPNTSFAVTTTYSDYDRYGNPATITVTANNQSRMSSKIHTASGRFVAGETDHLGETVTYIWDESKGLLTSKTSRLGTTTYLYDNWGRLKETIYPDGNRSVQTVQWAGDTGPSGAKYYSFSQASGEAPVYTWYDGLSREMRTESYGLNKNKIWVDTRYNTKGQVYRVSEPYFATDGIGAWAATYTYDVYGRQATVTTPMETTRFTYSGLSTTTTAPSRTKTTTTNPAGWTVSETTNGKTVTFTHYADGKVKTATPDGGMAVQLEYDLQGNRTRIIDPDAGTITSQYDAWGQLTREEQMVHKLPNAGPVITTYNYTSSGLLNWEQIGTERTTYEYDALHRLKKISILGKHEQEYSYDEYDRTIEIKDVVDGRTYTYGYGYDVLGRNNRVTYPSGYAIYNYYDRYGYLTSVKNQSGSSIWSALESNAKGQLKRTRKGNKETTYVYNSKNLLTDILTPETIQLNYAYNPDGTMLSRTDYRANQKEVFVYDNLKRLTGSTIRYANNPSGILASESVGYGNASSGYNDIYITSKSNFGVNMRYGEDGEPPHALTSFDASYRDAFPDQEITYTDFKKLQSIEQGSTLMNITYGVDRQRVKSQLTGPGTSLTRYYLGDYEEEVIDSNITRKIHYINGGDGLAAIHIEGSGYSSLYYTHTDFQGNLLMLTDANGNAIEEYAYDPWGNRRNPSNWTSSDIRTSFLIHRGYTMHEHLDHFGLINMNGRVYDPRAGMFLSPDPYIQAPGDWLNYNRYSYCMNNPLMYTDPDGEIFGIFLRGLSFIGGSLSNLIHGVNNPIKSAWNNSGNLVNGVSNSLQFPVFSNSNTLVTLGLDPLGLGLGGSVVHKSGSKITSSSRFGLSLLGGPYVNAGISYTNKDFNMSAGIGAGTNHWGWNASASGGKHGLGLGLGQTYYGNAIGPDGLSNSQTVGGYSILWDGGSFRIENDVFAFKNKNDRWRTNAWELTFGDFSVGSYIYTNDGNKASNGQLAGADENCESAIWGRNPHKDHGTWNNGRVYSSPLWVGYRVGNRISRIGFSHSSFQDLQQNGIHTTGFGKQNFYRMYDEFKSGLYLYSGHYNPFSLWGR